MTLSGTLPASLRLQREARTKLTLHSATVVALTLLTAPVAAEAQPTGKISRIGYLSVGSPSVNPARTEAFRQGLRELGYVDGKTIVIEYRYAEGKLLPLRADQVVE